MKKYLLLSVIFVLSVRTIAQTSDEDFKESLIDVLEDLQEEYDVRFKFNYQDFENYELKYAKWRLVPGDLEASLSNVLAPFDHIYVKQDDRTYKLKPFQYHLVTPEAGAAAIEHYTSLYSNRDEWESRRNELKACIWGALDIDQLPEVPNPKVVVNNKRKYNGYMIQNIALETLPGYYTTGSIYQPAKSKGKLPVILSPNGHFGNGRYHEQIQTRAAALAKMGAIVVTYDLFGWGESTLQVASTSHRKSIAHTIQTNNALKMLDYLLTLKDADPDRVGITGGSGGGSQTMLVSAIDARIKVSVPVVMTSSFHSGGCPCESGMPIHLCGGKTNNAEIAAIFAPKPMLIVSDGGDWTFQVPDVEYPFIKRIYEFYDQADKVENVHFANEGHDYGFSKRKAMYEFMARYLGLDLDAITNKNGQIDDSGVVVEEFSKLYVFDNDINQLPDDAIRTLDELYKSIE